MSPKIIVKLEFNTEKSLNSKIHTDAIKGNLIPPKLSPVQVTYTYASEADLLNVVLLGKTAKQ